MSGRRVFTPAMMIVMGVLLLGAAGLTGVIKASGYYLTKLPIEPQEKLHTLPTDYPSWVRVGEDEIMTAEGEQELGTKNYLSRRYMERTPPGDRPPIVMNVHLAYYTGMIDTVPHVPERCLVAAGWLQTGAPQLIDLPIDQSLLVKDSTVDPAEMGGTVWMGRSPTTHARVRLPIGVEKMQMRVSPFENQTGDKFMAGYFFVANGGTVPSADDIRLLAFRLNDDYAYYVKIQFSSGSFDSAEEFVTCVASMLDEMLPDIMLRLPDWVEVKEGRYPDPQTGGKS